MDMMGLGQIALAFLFVLGLIGLSAFLARKFGLQQRLMGGHRTGGRLGVEETFYIDPRRKLVLLRRDEVFHLVLVGQEGELLIEQNIPRYHSQGEAKHEAS